MIMCSKVYFVIKFCSVSVWASAVMATHTAFPKDSSTHSQLAAQMVYQLKHIVFFTVFQLGKYDIIEGIKIDSRSKQKMFASAEELIEERNAVAEMLGDK